EFRMGINLGDIMKDGRDIYGDGVNVAARLEALAEPGGICVSRVVRDQVRDKLSFSFEDLGEQQVKNIARPVRVHRILLGERPSPLEPAMGPSTKSPLSLPDKPSIAVLPFANMSGDPEQEYFADGMVEEIITAQLIDAQSGTHLWADRFDGSLEDVFELQDQVATNVAGVIEPALQAAET